MRADLASEFAKLAPWVFRFRIDGADYGGATTATTDRRVDEFLRFAPTATTILDLGSLAACHPRPPG